MADWKIKRGNQEFAAPNVDTLRQWAASGRVVASDYIFNPTLQRWMYAREIEELAAVWRTTERAASSKGGCAATIALGLLALMFFMWNMNLLGVVLLLGAVAAMVFTLIKR